MALTPLLSTGFETGLTTPHGAAVGAGTTIVAGAACTGTYGLRVTAPANTATRFQLNSFTANAKLAIRFAIKVSSRPSSATAIIFPNTSVFMTVSSTGALALNLNGGSIQTGPTIDTTSFHRVELQLDTAAKTCDWKIDGVAQTQATTASALTNLGVINLGTDSTTQPAYTADFDDFIVGTWATAGTDWWGNGGSTGYTVTSDGTHSFTANDFSTGDAGTVRASSYTQFFDMINDATPWTATRSTTDNIAQRVARTTGYVECIIGGASGGITGNNVMALIAYSASGTAADTAGTIIRNSAGTANTIFGDLPTAQGGNNGALADYSEATNFFVTTKVTAPGAGWTDSEVNSLRFRFGGSNDINPIPTLQMVMVEVDKPIPNVYTSGPTASLTFAASDTVKTFKGISAVSSFTGSITKNIVGTAKASSLSFTGSVSRLRLVIVALTAASLSFTGSKSSKAIKSLAGIISFTGSQNRKIFSSISGGLTYIGSRTSRTALAAKTASITFTGSITKAFPRTLTGAVSFAGSHSRKTIKAVSSALSFAGTVIKSPRKTITAVISFTVTIVRRTNKLITSVFSFTGSQTKRIFKTITGGAISFLASFVTAASEHIAFLANLTFTSEQAKSTHKLISGATSFTGVLTQSALFIKTLTSVLSFTGSFSTTFVKIFTAVLAFTGSRSIRLYKFISSSIAFIRIITPDPLLYPDPLTYPGETTEEAGIITKLTSTTKSGAISFTGSVSKTINKFVTTVLSFTGDFDASLVITVIYQALDSALSFTGTQTKRTFKTITAGLTNTSSLIRSIRKTITAALSFTGVTSIIKSLHRTLTAVLSFVGSTNKKIFKGISSGFSFVGTTLKSPRRTLTGAIAFAGSLISTNNKTLTAVISFTGSQTKRVFKYISGAFSFTGATIKSVRKNITASISFVGSLVRSSLKLLIGTISFVRFIYPYSELYPGDTYPAGIVESSSLFKAISINKSGALSFIGSFTRLNAFRRTIEATLSFTGTQTKSIFKTLTSGVLDFAGNLAVIAGNKLYFVADLTFTAIQNRRTFKTVASAVSFTGTTTKRTHKYLSSTALTFAGTISRLSTLAINFVGNLTLSGTQNRSVYKIVTSTLSFSGIKTMRLLKTLSGTINSTGSLVTSIINKLTLTATLTFTGIKNFRFSKILSGVLGFSGVNYRSINKGLTASISFSSRLIKSVQKLLESTVSLIGSITRKTIANLSSELIIIGSLSTGEIIGVLLTASLTFTGSITKNIGKTISGALGLIGNLVRRLLRIPPFCEPLIAVLEEGNESVLLTDTQTYAIITVEPTIAILSEFSTIMFIADGNESAVFDDTTTTGTIAICFT